MHCKNKKAQKLITFVPFYKKGEKYEKNYRKDTKYMQRK